MVVQTNAAPQGSGDTASEEIRSERREREAPRGTLDFSTITARVGINRIDTALKPYLDEINQLIHDNLSGTEFVTLDRVPNSFVWLRNDDQGRAKAFIICFVSSSDPVSPKMLPATTRMDLAFDEVKDRFEDRNVQIIDSRLVMAGFEDDMNRCHLMADVMVRAFQFTTINEFADATIAFLESTKFNVDWNIEAARQFERQRSPHGVPARLDVAMTISAAGEEDRDRDIWSPGEKFLTIGGYTTIGEREEHMVDGKRVLLFRPIFHVSTCISTIPLEGVAAIGMGVLFPSIYDELFWARQWTDLKGPLGNPGNIETDPETGEPIELKNQEELVNFVRNNFAQPIIVFDMMDGRDSIPGMWRMAADGPKREAITRIFIRRIAEFFEVETPKKAGDQVISRSIGESYEGVYGAQGGQLKDSRDIDFLWCMKHKGSSSLGSKGREILMNPPDRPEELALLRNELVGSFTPLWLCNQVAVNPDFVRWVVEAGDTARISISDPNQRTNYRPLSSRLAGFGSAADMGSMVDRRSSTDSINLRSVWSR